MQPLANLLTRITSLEETAKTDLLDSFERICYARGEHILPEDRISKHFYFIEEGLAKSCFNGDGKEFIMTFFRENMIFTEFSSYITQRPSKYMITSLEETTVHRIHRDHIEALCKKHHCVETLFKKLYSFGTLGMMNRISEMLEDNASARYEIFMQENKDLVQRISLGDMARYLGITQVSLSRIRTAQ